MMNQMNMPGMNTMGGGPVGGMPVMNNGAAATPRSDFDSVQGLKLQLNTYIYDYFIKSGYYDCARVLINSDFPVNTQPNNKTSPGHRDVNGVDENAMDADSKDDPLSRCPDDLPRPSVPGDGPQSAFLFDWFGLFWDVYAAQRKKSRSGDASQYLQHTQACRTKVLL